MQFFNVTNVLGIAQQSPHEILRIISITPSHYNYRPVEISGNFEFNMDAFKCKAGDQVREKQNSSGPNKRREGKSPGDETNNQIVGRDRKRATG